MNKLKFMLNLNCLVTKSSSNHLCTIQLAASCPPPPSLNCSFRKKSFGTLVGKGFLLEGWWYTPPK